VKNLTIADRTETSCVEYRLEHPIRVRPVEQRARISTTCVRVERTTGVGAVVSAWLEDEVGGYRWVALQAPDQAEVLASLGEQPATPNPGEVLEAAAARLRALEQRAAPHDSGGLAVAADQLDKAALGWHTGSLRVPDILAAGVAAAESAKGRDGV
jgi:hypothetical protein